MVINQQGQTRSISCLIKNSYLVPRRFFVDPLGRSIESDPAGIKVGLSVTGRFLPIVKFKRMAAVYTRAIRGGLTPLLTEDIEIVCGATGLE